VRWRERARTTKDLDLALRERPADGEDLLDLLVEQLSEDPDGDGFRFVIGQPSPLPDDTAGRPAWRFAARALLAGREFARIKIVDASSAPRSSVRTGVETGLLTLPRAVEPVMRCLSSSTGICYRSCAI